MLAQGIFTTKAGNEMGWTLYGSALPKHSPIVVYLHGFKGFKDWGFVPHAGKQFAEKGIRLLAVNFSHNGLLPHGQDFTETERFRENTFSLERSEAIEIMVALVDGRLGVEVSGPVGLMGHSRGGGISLLSVNDCPFIKALVTWASVSTFKRYPPEVIERWERDGYLDVVNARTKQVLQLGWNLHADLLKHTPGVLDIQAAAANVSVPYLIVHGTQDEAVGIDDAHQIHHWTTGKSELFLVDGAGHTFGAKHPWEGSNPHFDAVLDRTIQFFTQHLN